MSKFIVVVFPDGKKAYEGMHALNELHNEGNITLYGSAVVERNSKGALSTKEKKAEGPIGTGLGALLGGLIGMFAGPVGVAIGLGAGTAAGGLRDLFNLGVGNEFVESVSSTLSPGKTAVIAEISEEWVTPLDTRMAELGATVIRETRNDFIEDEIDRRVSSHKADVAQRRQERAAMKAAKAEAKLQKQLEKAEEKLRQMGENARARVEEYKREFDAKLDALRTQASHASPDAKAHIEERIAEMREDEQLRLRKLEHAWKITQDALRP
jgi:uncharacterized membrane protein